MTGIVGRALAGGGAALEVAGLKILQSQLDEMRQTKLQELSQRHQTSLQESNQAFTADQNRLGREHQENLQGSAHMHQVTLQDARLGYERERDEANRVLTREQIESNERQQAANRKNAMEIAKIGGSVTQDKDGNVIWMNKEGKATQVIDPTTGKPMVGHKDLTPAAKAYADVIKQQLKNLDTMEASPMTDDNQRATINSRRTQLNTELLNVLTGGIGQAGQGGGGQQGRTGWDSGTKQVMLNGQPIGTAESEADARRMVANARKPKAQAAPQTDEPSTALVEEPEEETPPVRRGRERRGIINRQFDPELLNQE